MSVDAKDRNLPLDIFDTKVKIIIAQSEYNLLLREFEKVKLEFRQISCEIAKIVSKLFKTEKSDVYKTITF